MTSSSRSRAAAGPAHAGVAERQAWALELRAVLRQLDSRQNAVVRLVYDQGLTHKQAAARLGWPAQLVAAELAGALRHVGTLLGAEPPARPQPMRRPISMDRECSGATAAGAPEQDEARQTTREDASAEPPLGSHPAGEEHARRNREQEPPG